MGRVWGQPRGFPVDIPTHWHTGAQFKNSMHTTVHMREDCFYELSVEIKLTGNNSPDSAECDILGLATVMCWLSLCVATCVGVSVQNALVDMMQSCATTYKSWGCSWMHTNVHVHNGEC